MWRRHRRRRRRAPELFNLFERLRVFPRARATSRRGVIVVRISRKYTLHFVMDSRTRIFECLRVCLRMRWEAAGRVRC